MPRLPLMLVSLSAAALLSACVVAPYPHRVVYAQPVPAGQPVPLDSEVVIDVAPAARRR